MGEGGSGWVGEVWSGMGKFGVGWDNIGCDGVVWSVVLLGKWNLEASASREQFDNSSGDVYGWKKGFLKSIFSHKN